MSKTQELLHLKEEVRAAVCGLNQEIKEIILKYDKLLKIDAISVGLTSNHTDNFDAETIFVLADEECDPEVLSVLEKPIFGDDEDADVEELVAQEVAEELGADVEDLQAMQKEIDLTDDDAEEIAVEEKPLQKVPVKMLNTKAHITLAYRNSKSKAVLFETNPIIQ